MAETSKKSIYFLAELKRHLSPSEGSRLFLWLGAVLISGFLAFYWDYLSQKINQTDPRSAESPDTADTFIPSGFVLVPIEVANSESLDSILGSFGVVDLYLPGKNAEGHSIKIAERVKILRAPLNPQKFAVLVSEEDSPRLVTQEGSFTVVIQNPSERGTRFAALKSPPRSRQVKSMTVSRIHIEVPYDAESEK